LRKFRYPLGTFFCVLKREKTNFRTYFTKLNLLNLTLITTNQ